MSPNQHSPSPSPARPAIANELNGSERTPLLSHARSNRSLKSGYSNSEHGGRRASFSHASVVSVGLPAEDAFVDENAVEEDAEEGGAEAPTLKQEFKVLTKYATPVLLNQLLRFAAVAANTLSVSHLGPFYLASTALASLTLNVTGLSIALGLCTALDTLCSQAWTANPRMMNIYMLRTALLLVCLLPLQYVVYYNSEAILLALGQEPKIASLAATYLKISSLGLPANAGFECVRRWMQAQGQLRLPTLIATVICPLTIALNFFLVWGPEPFRMGFIGAPVATAISLNIQFILVVIAVIKYVPPHPSLAASGKSAPWLSREVFRDLWPNIGLGAAGVLQLCSEWWCWEIVGFASSYFGTDSLGAQSVLMTTSSLTYQIPIALCISASIRVGNLLGARRPLQAALAARAAILLALIVGAAEAVLLFLFRHVWARVFTDYEPIVVLVASILPVMGLLQSADAIAGVCGGVMRGASRAPASAVISLAGYYFVGIPVGFALAFSPAFRLELYGLWIGLMISLFMVAGVSVWYILRIPWEDEAIKIAERADRDRLEQETMTTAA